MSREVRRVPVDWKHPVEPNPYWEHQTRDFLGFRRPPSRLHAQTERFVPLCDDYPDALARWEQDGRDLAERSGHSWDFAMRWSLTGYDDCTCHPGGRGVIHPQYVWDDPNEETPVLVRDADHLHEILLAQHDAEKPDPAEHMPVFGVPEEQLGWCLYQTVSEGSPTTPAFATAEELIEHLVTVGEDYDQEPYRREAAEALVSTGHSFGSFAMVGGQLFDGAKDLDRLPRASS